jgi:hypothetical protein
MYSRAYVSNIPWPPYLWVCGLVLCEAVSGTLGGVMVPAYPLIPPLVSYHSWDNDNDPCSNDAQRGRVLSFFSSRRNWNSPTPLAAGECTPPPHPLVRVGGHTCLREWGWGSPNSNAGTYTVVLCIHKYFVQCAP